MLSILEIKHSYSKKVDPFDLELLISAAINRPREFVLAHPEYILEKSQISNLKLQISRRIEYEPIAYILGHKEFYGLDFKVDKNTLIPRPETELLVELALKKIRNTRYKVRNTFIIDIGTGSGSVIISIAKAISNLKSKTRPTGRQVSNLKFIGIDISKEALKIARHNSKKYSLDKKTKFLHGNLLEPIIDRENKKQKIKNYIIVANLPYLSEKIYSQAPLDVKKYEPKSALFSKKQGLNHYENLFVQIQKMQNENCKMQTFLEISPEQKKLLVLLIKKYFPEIKPIFHKDLAGKWRVCEITL